MKNKTFKITDIDKNKRLDKFLLEKFDKSFSRNHIQNWIDKQLVFVNNIPAFKNGLKLKENDIVLVNMPSNIKLEAQPENIPLDIIYQDEYLAVINKPQGMVVHAGNGNHDKTLVNALLYHFKDLSGINGVLRPGIVHRLDKNTSGLMLVAKNDIAHIELAKQIENKTCKREYIAILEGNLKQDNGIITTHISRHPKNRKIMTVCLATKGKLAITEYKVIERYKDYCLVQFNLKTGRTHQIRVHCKNYLHHPIANDTEYGGKPPKILCKNDKKSLGQYLVAITIEFVHPFSKKIMKFTLNKLPTYFEVFLKKLRKNYL